MINLDCLDCSYKYDNLFQETTIYSHLSTLINELIKVNKDPLSHKNDTQNLDDSVNSNQNWNYTNDEFTGYGGFKLLRRYDEIKLNFKLNYDFNTSKKIETNEINCFMSKNKVYNKVELQIKVKPFGFPPSNNNFNILPFGSIKIKHESSTFAIIISFPKS